jgi:mannose-6-phosphate isomerase-like protein (cupin superfamily)
MVSPTATQNASAVRFGAALTFESLDCREAPVRVRAREDTLLRVIAGRVRMTVEGRVRLLGPGEEAIVPAGAPHRIAGAEGEAHVVMGFRRP